MPTLDIFDAARDAPERTALITDAGAISFRELAARVEDALQRRRGQLPDDGRAVALVARPDTPTLVLVHACIARGTPMVLLHPRLTRPERAALLEAAGRPRVVTPDDEESAPSSEPPAGPDGAAVPGHRTLAVVFTSGSTGRPRGVRLSRDAFMASAAASATNLGWEEDDRWLLPLPVAHVGGLSIVTRCLLARRAVVLARSADAGAMLDAIRRHRVTLLSVVPTMLNRLLDHESDAGRPPHLRAVLVGGAPASSALLRRAADAGWPVLTTYGLTEACSQVTTQPYGTVNRGQLGAGRPLPGIEVRIGDDDAIEVRGPTLFDGYLDAPAAGASRSHGGWFDTGDRGRLDPDGFLHVRGRRSDRIVSGGENVDPLEVEDALTALPAVRAACVFGVPDAEWGEVVSAALVVEPGFDAAAAVAALRARLAGHKLPRRVALLDALPRNATGKVDRREVARVAAPSLREVARAGS